MDSDEQLKHSILGVSIDEKSCSITPDIKVELLRPQLIFGLESYLFDSTPEVCSIFILVNISLNFALKY